MRPSRFTLVPNISRHLAPKRLSIRLLTTQKRTMAVFRHGGFIPDASFSPLFRLLDDFDHYTRQEGGHRNSRRSTLSQFQPRFDLHETGESYELHGELPGMSKENVQIDFTEPQSMLIRGKLERAYTAGKPPAGQIEGTAQSSAITDCESAQESSDGTFLENQGNVENAADQTKYWLTERSVGVFSRSFNFPTPVDRDAVSASLKDGVLSVVVPKAKIAESRRITVS